MIYTKEHAAELQELLAGCAPVVRVNYSDLGGAHNASLMILIVLDERETWKYGIMENSRYARFAVHSKENKLEQFSKPLEVEKFRKTSVKSITEIAEKLKVWIAKNQGK